MIFSLELEISGVAYRADIKTAKNSNFWEEFLSENDFEAVLAAFCCYDNGPKASEAVQKIAVDQKEYCKCSSCVINWWIEKVYLSISNNEKMVGYKDTSNLAKKVAKVSQKEDQ